MNNEFVPDIQYTTSSVLSNGVIVDLVVVVVVVVVKIFGIVVVLVLTVVVVVVVVVVVNGGGVNVLVVVDAVVVWNGDRVVVENMISGLVTVYRQTFQKNIYINSNLWLKYLWIIKKNLNVTLRLRKCICYWFTLNKLYKI